MHPKYGNNDRCCIDYKLVVRLWLKISHRMPMKLVKTEGVNDRIAMLKAMAEVLNKNRANVVSGLGFSSINAYTVLSEIKWREKGKSGQLRKSKHHLIDNGGTSTPSKATIDRRISPDYEAMIFEALFSTKDPNGADTNEILSFIQQRYELPDNFKRSVTLMLRRLTLSGELEKVNNHFTIYKGESFSDEAPIEEDVGPCEDEKMDEKKEEMDKCDSPIGTETMEDAALYAAITVARAENTMQKAIEACQEADSFVEDVEESIAMLRVAEELHKKCKEDGFVLLAP
ncbi:hypothetical protein LXL04_036742 [Taraxacum kok-saghyz]